MMTEHPRFEHYREVARTLLLRSGQDTPDEKLDEMARYFCALENDGWEVGATRPN